MASGPNFQPVTAFQPVSQPDTSSRKPLFSEGPEGQATYGMANLRPEKTGLPFIVFISQRDDASHDVWVKVSPAPRIRRDQMGSYALRPSVEWKAGWQMSRKDEQLLEQWVELNRKVLIEYWDGAIEFTEDAMDRLVKL